MAHLRDQKVIAHPSLPAPSRRRCCHRARRGQSQPADGRDGRLGLSCDGCAQPKVGRVDARPISTQRRCRGEETTSMDCVTLPARGGHGSTPKGQTRHSVHVLECRDLVGERLRPCGLAASVTQSIDVVTSPRHRRWWRQLELISARSCALTLWILGTDAHATYAGAEAAPVAHCGP